MKQLTECTMELFTLNDCYYAFDSSRLFFWKITKEIYELLEYVRKNRCFDRGSFAAKDIMLVMLKINKGLFFRENKLNNSNEGMKTDQLVISFPIVHNCNLNCKYCFAESGEIYKGAERKISTQVIDGIIEFIQKRFSEIKKIRLEFVSGGETLLDKERFFDIVEYFKEKIEIKGLKLDIFLLTNGTTIDEYVLQRLEKIGVFLGISLDGTEEIQNYQRPMKTGEKSYDLVVDTIKIIRQNPVFKDRIWVVSVITAKTHSLQEILEHNIGLGINSMEMRVVRGNNPKELTLNKETLDIFKEKYAQFSGYLKKNTSNIIYIINDYDTFGKIIRRMLLNIGVYYRCMAGAYKYSFTADGDIYACDSFVGHEEFKLGNVLNGMINEELLERYRKLSVVDCFSCADCAYRFWCGGDCNYNAFCANGAMDNKKSVFCELQIFLCQLAIDLIEFIKLEDRSCYNFLVKYVKRQSKMIYKNDCLED